MLGRRARRGRSCLTVPLRPPAPAPPIQSAPLRLRRRTARALACKVVLAARIDAARGSPNGSAGAAFRADIAGKLAKWQEPPPGKSKKALPLPDDRPSKKRGGRRQRKVRAGSRGALCGLSAGVHG